MSLPQKTPGEGGKNRRVHFRYVGTANGGKWNGYIAGPCHWFLCHSKGKTKPCLHALTDGELDCDLCSPMNEATWTGYLPLWRCIDSAPVMVIVHEHQLEAMNAVKLHAKVLVGRGDDPADGVYVLPALDPNPRFTTAMPWKMNAVDLTETLLAVWKLPCLVEWYRRTHGGKQNRAPLPPSNGTKEKRPSGEEFSEMYQAAARRWTPPPEPSTASGIPRPSARG